MIPFSEVLENMDLHENPTRHTKSNFNVVRAIKRSCIFFSTLVDTKNVCQFNTYVVTVSAILLGVKLGF
jgi:hypothetical protein